jgi:hypothetical protein
VCILIEDKKRKRWNRGGKKMIKEVHYYDPTAKGDEIKTIYFCYCEECGALLYKRVFRDNLDIKRYFKEEHKPDCTEKDNEEIW